MASAAFLLAPATPIPTERDDDWEGACLSWIHHADMAWYEIHDSLTPRERRLAGNAFKARGFSGNLAAATKIDESALEKSAREYVAAAYASWVEGGRLTPPPQAGPGEFAEQTDTPSKICISSLIHFRGGFKRLPRKRLLSGAAEGFLCNTSQLDAISIGQTYDYELSAFFEITRAYGGHSLALWTYGRAVHVLFAQSPAAGSRPVVTGPHSFRVDRPVGAPRGTGGLDALRHAMVGAPYTPDWNAVEQQLAADQVSITAWFEAFGIAGARELIPVDRSALWEAFDALATSLLAGQHVSPREIRPINAIIAPLDGQAKLKTKPSTRPGQTARMVADAAFALGEGLGFPSEGVWTTRRAAAEYYWDITDCPAGDRLTVGVDKAHLGESAALGRLLGHYPKALLRDPIFLAVAALEAEAANGHAFVQSLLVLAEGAREAGFTLLIHPAGQEEAFRKAFGIREGGANLPVDGNLAHAFVDLPGYTKKEPAEAITAWLMRYNALGLVLRAEADGTVQMRRFEDGAEVDPPRVDPQTLAAAGRSLSPRDTFCALDLADLLAPGDWHVGAYGGDRDHDDDQKRHARAAIGDPAQPVHLDHPRDLRWHSRPMLSYHGDKNPNQDGIVAFALAWPSPDERSLSAIRDDLRGDDLVEEYGTVWCEQGQVLGFTRARLDLDLFATVIADLPRPVQVVLDMAQEETWSFSVG